MSQHSFDWNKEVCGKSSAILTDSSGKQTVLFSERRHDSTYELLEKGSVVWLPKEEYGLCESALLSEIPVKYPRCGLAECPYCNRAAEPSIDSHDLCLIKGFGFSGGSPPTRILYYIWNGKEWEGGMTAVRGVPRLSYWLRQSDKMNHDMLRLVEPDAVSATKVPRAVVEAANARAAAALVKTMSLAAHAEVKSVPHQCGSPNKEPWPKCCREASVALSKQMEAHYLSQQN
jgi:hypothetical protein